MDVTSRVVGTTTREATGWHKQAEIGLTGEDDATQEAVAPVAILEWPTDLPAQVAAVRKLLPSIGQDPERLAACFGRESQKRTAQITAILDTLKSAGTHRLTELHGPESGDKFVLSGKSSFLRKAGASV